MRYLPLGRRWLVAARAHLGACADARDDGSRPALGGRPMILRLTPKTAELIGKTSAEWQLLEKQARVGQRTTVTRSDEGQLRAFAAEVGVTLREEGVVPLKRRGCKRKLPGA